MSLRTRDGWTFDDQPSFAPVRQLDAVERQWLGVDVDTPDGPGQVVARHSRNDSLWISNGSRCWDVRIADLTRPDDHDQGVLA